MVTSCHKRSDEGKKVGVDIIITGKMIVFLFCLAGYKGKSGL